MSTLLLRDATESQRAEALKLWGRSWVREMERDTPTAYGLEPFVCGLAPFVWQHAHQAAIAQLVVGAHIVVAVLEEVPNEPLGWVCWTDPGVRPVALHYVYVYGPVRKKGIGTALLRHALEHADDRVPHSTHMNQPGQALLAKAVGQDRAA